MHCYNSYSEYLSSSHPDPNRLQYGQAHTTGPFHQNLAEATLPDRVQHQILHLIQDDSAHTTIRYDRKGGIVLLSSGIGSLLDGVAEEQYKWGDQAHIYRLSALRELPLHQ